VTSHHGEDRLTVGRSVPGRRDHLAHLEEVGGAEQARRRNAENRRVLIPADGEAVDRAAWDEQDVARADLGGSAVDRGS
jgi:hypothetical protein